MLYANELQMCLIMCCLSDSKEIQRQPIMFFFILRLGSCILPDRAAPQFQ